MCVCVCMCVETEERERCLDIILAMVIINCVCRHDICNLQSRRVIKMSKL